MSIDFALILVLATAVTGFIWAVDSLLFRRQRVREAARSGAGEPVRDPAIVEYARSFFPIILIVLIVRSFLYEPFRIPSSSMMPTLLIGDFIFVNKYVYGLRLPVANSLILPVGEPARGDVVVFKLPADPGTNFIKRVVGLPGDRIRYYNKQLFVNDERVETELNGFYAGPGPADARIGIERLDGVEHEVLLQPHGYGPNGEYLVPEQHYFVMGDNRGNSHDSRYPDVGYIPAENLVGKAVMIWMNWDWTGKAPIWNRIGDRIR
ncbi:MAG TPA: signal peptidase I [Gammaproteobacteria bacterium]|nr:signal peptidase I [Gammaproteobacteria bacterium]